MISENPFLKFSLIVLKILAVFTSILLLLSIVMLIISGGGAVLFPGLGLIIEFAGIAVLLTILTVALWALIFLLSKFIKRLH